jgi:hypothetical protein
LAQKKRIVLGCDVAWPFPPKEEERYKKKSVSCVSQYGATIPIMAVNTREEDLLKEAKTRKKKKESWPDDYFRALKILHLYPPTNPFFYMISNHV